ncbi:uncharacterized protein LOC103519169 [Diaphorina citri]|uniref:Hairy and enhancer of split-related protein HELT n=1 Tax=Diaphorina citri TaxID=121845 RepID=A0A3Q0JHI2_DIACI|nr:uncharacterized protein LOC103519169 [Diaphorina citri]
METQNPGNFVIWTNSNSNCSSNGGIGGNSGRSPGPNQATNMVKCEKSLNFSTVVTSEEDEYGYHDRRKMSRDPMSHRIIEKRRRDRMNNCLADLSRLIPADYLKKGRGRIEKTEIIEMAIKHMKYLHSVVCTRTPNANPSNELPLENSQMLDNYDQDSKVSGKEETSEHNPSKPTENSSSITELDPNKPEGEGSPAPINLEHFKLGYQECLSESMHYLVEVKGYYPGSSLCMQLICHLQKHCDKLLKGDRLNKPCTGDSTSTSNSPNSTKPHGSASSSSDSCERLQMPKQEPTESYDRDQSFQREQYESAAHLLSQHRESYERAIINHQRSQYDPASTPRDYQPTSPLNLREGANRGRENLTLPNLSLFNIEQEQCPTSDHRMIMRHPQQDEVSEPML